MRNIFLYLVFSIFLLSIFTIMTSSKIEIVELDNEILYVGGFGNYNYSKIQDAINDSTHGDIIFIFNGTYYENIIVDKSIQLQGEDKNKTIIDSEGKGDVIKIISDEVLLYDITVQNGGKGQDFINDACIEVCSNYTVIHNVNCYNTNYGIWIRDCKKTTIVNTICDCFYDGIWMINSKNNILRNNSMINCSIVLDGSSISDFIQDIDTSNTVNQKPVYYYKNQSGKSISFQLGQIILVNCDNFTIHHLHLTNITDGIELFYSHDNFIEYNTITNMRDFGIRLVESNNNIFQYNTITNNPIGIGFTSGGIWEYLIPAHCNNNIVIKNEISHSSHYGIYLDSSCKNKFYQNNFKENSEDILFINSYRNRWLKNYWDRPRFLPKIFFGWLINDISIPIINFDFYPAKLPQI